MLIRRAQLEAIQNGTVTLQFRRWRKPTVKTGGTLRTAIGVLAIDRVDVVSLEALTVRDARAAGYDSLASLRQHVEPGDGDVYRISLHFAGADPRGALRQQSALSVEEHDALRTKLDRLDARSNHGPWTWRTLELIAANPGLYSGDLADQLKFERLWLKAQIRKLKELGLTESLDVGYRVSPRGEALRRRLRT